MLDNLLRSTVFDSELEGKMGNNKDALESLLNAFYRPFLFDQTSFTGSIWKTFCIESLVLCQTIKFLPFLKRCKTPHVSHQVDTS